MTTECLSPFGSGADNRRPDRLTRPACAFGKGQGEFVDLSEDRVRAKTSTRDETVQTPTPEALGKHRIDAWHALVPRRELRDRDRERLGVHVAGPFVGAGRTAPDSPGSRRPRASTRKARCRHNEHYTRSLSEGRHSYGWHSSGVAPPVMRPRDDAERLNAIGAPDCVASKQVTTFDRRF